MCLRVEHPAHAFAGFRTQCDGVALQNGLPSIRAAAAAAGGGGGAAAAAAVVATSVISGRV